MAKKWLELAAADERDSGAAFYLGLLYDDGQGTATNYKVAEKWYRQAAERGNPFAMEKLGLLLLKGVWSRNPAPKIEKKRTSSFLQLLRWGTTRLINSYSQWKPIWERTALMPPGRKLWIFVTAFTDIRKGNAVDGTDNSAARQRLHHLIFNSLASGKAIPDCGCH